MVVVTVAGAVIAWLAPISDEGQPSVWAYVGVFTFVIFGWLVSLCLHEFGHAYTAWRYGDRDVAVRGYLTLNPLKYANPLLSLGLPALFIAWGGIGLPGGAVYVRTAGMTAQQKSFTSLAGPLVNAVLALVLLTVTALFYDETHFVFWAGMAFLGFLQVTGLLLNMLPVPGLDGYGALEPHLSREVQVRMNPVKQYGFFILIILLFVPLLNEVFFSVVLDIVGLTGVDQQLVGWGMRLTRFWSSWF